MLGTDGYYLGLDDGFEPDAEALLSVQGRMNSGALVGLGFGSGGKKNAKRKRSRTALPAVAGSGAVSKLRTPADDKIGDVCVQGHCTYNRQCTYV